MLLKEFWGLIRDTSLEWINDKVPRLSAALAYYTVLSMAPLLIIVIAVAGLVFGREAAQGQLVGQIKDLVGADGARAIQMMLAHAYQPTAGIISTVIGIVVLLVGATGVFGELQDSLNTIWKVQPKAGRGIWGLLKDRFLSFAMVLGIGFLLLVSLAVSAGISALNHFVGGLITAWEPALEVINFLVTLGIFTLLFALIYKVLPDVKISWKDVWFGAVVTALLFDLGKYLIGLYLGNSSIGSAYGAAGSFVVLVVWIYYSSLILFYGAEFTRVYADRYGTRIAPAENAERMTPEALARQGLPTGGRSAPQPSGA